MYVYCLYTVLTASNDVQQTIITSSLFFLLPSSSSLPISSSCLHLLASTEPSPHVYWKCSENARDEHGPTQFRGSSNLRLYLYLYLPPTQMYLDTCPWHRKRGNARVHTTLILRLCLSAVSPAWTVLIPHCPANQFSNRYCSICWSSYLAENDSPDRDFDHLIISQPHDIKLHTHVIMSIRTTYFRVPSNYCPGTLSRQCPLTEYPDQNLVYFVLVIVCSCRLLPPLIPCVLFCTVASAPRSTASPLFFQGAQCHFRRIWGSRWIEYRGLFGIDLFWFVLFRRFSFFFFFALIVMGEVWMVIEFYPVVLGPVISAR